MTRPQPSQSSSTAEHRCGPAFDERGIGRYHDVELMARTAIRATERGDMQVALAAVVLPSVLDRVVAIQAEEGWGWFDD